MASKVDIWNRALQKLGAKRVTSVNDTGVNGLACNACYDAVLEKVLRKHRWNCSIKRAELAAELTAPDWGRQNAFQVPADYVTLANDYPEMASNCKDWVVEGGFILTNDSAPLQIRYVSRMTDVNLMDGLLRETISTHMALEMCEELTQSNTKKETLRADLKDVITDAKKANAIENVPMESPEDSWVTGRS